MPDAPDRETLEYRNAIVAVISPTKDVRRNFIKRTILSDPDWRAWLGKNVTDRPFKLPSGYTWSRVYPTIRARLAGWNPWWLVEEL